MGCRAQSSLLDTTEINSDAAASFPHEVMPQHSVSEAAVVIFTAVSV